MFTNSIYLFVYISIYNYVHSEESYSNVCKYNVLYKGFDFYFLSRITEFESDFFDTLFKK